MRRVRVANGLAMLGAGALVCASACAGAGAGARGAADDRVVRGRLAGGGAAVVVAIDGETIASVAPVAPGAAVADRWIVPGVIDAHVHLAFWPVARDVA